MIAVPRPKHSRRKHFIRQWREHRGLTQVQMSERLQVSQATYSRIEAGKSPYSQDFLEATADALSCTPADLLMRDPTRANALWSISDQLAHADEETARKVVAVVAALLKTG